MENNRPAKSKQTQHNLLSSVLAEFDIQTQVNKMVMRSFDSLMRSNKQAFDFIKQSEHNFINFQQRLSKAETYYKNIESNINSKVQLTDNMSKRLQEFSTQFWTAIKDNNNEVTTMTKKFDQVLMEKRQLQNRMVQCQKQTSRLDNASNRLNNKINEEVLKLVGIISDNEKKTDQRFLKESKQLREISQNIIESRSLLESKSDILSELLKDLQLYKHDSPQIKVQLQTIFNELQNRALKTDVIQVRGYVDSKIVEQREVTKKLWMRIDTHVKVQQRDRKRDVEKIHGLIKQTNDKLQQNKNNVEQLLKNETQRILDVVLKNEQKSQKNLQQLSIILSILQTKYGKQVPQLFTKQSQLSISLTDTNTRVKDSSNQIKQLFSNNESINQMIQMIVRENEHRKEQMLRLTSSSQNSGNMQQQLMVLFQRVNQIQKDVGNIKNNLLQNVSKDIVRIDERLQQNKIDLSLQIKQLNKRVQINQSITQKQIFNIDNSLKTQISQKSQQLSYKISQLKQSTINMIQQKITSIQHKLNSLQQIHNEIKQFKQVFQKQIQQNDQVNISIAQKVQRVMALFTKLKSDNTVKFQQLNTELNKRTMQIKSSLLELDEIKKYLSLVNQTINLLLVVNISKQPSNNNKDKDPTSSLNSSLLNSTSAQNRDRDEQSQQSQPQKPIKIASMIQGWVMQTDQTHQKIKYRGQNLTNINRIKFLLSFLQYSVKKTEKIKGTILENGRDIFMKVLQANQDMFSQRKRTISRRKPSELPKLYM